MDQTFSEFRYYLQEEYLKRKAKNPQYSLRAYAQSLNINAGCLSVLMNGKRNLTKKMVLKLASRLSLNAQMLRQLLSDKAQKDFFQEIDYDAFSLLCHWYYDAILELARCQHFIPSPKWIAAELKLDIQLVHVIIDRLVRFKYIKIDRQGNWKLLRPNTNFMTNDWTSVALKSLQKEVLEQSLQALEQIHVKERYHSSFTMAIDPKKLSEAKDYLREFRKKFCRKVQNEGELKKVYQLQIGFFPVH